jgi:6,7-dimethyl-8-ribityllumazine synthase
MSKKTAKRAAPKDNQPRIAIVVSLYNETITQAMAMAAIEECADRTGYTPAVFEAPGAFELTALSMAVAKSGEFDGIVALGCVIKGETSHDQYIASAVAHGLTNVTLLTDIPVAFGVLTTNTVRQAEERAGLSKKATGNKGREAMSALLDTLLSLAVIENPKLAATIAAEQFSQRPDKAKARGARP